MSTLQRMLWIVGLIVSAGCAQILGIDHDYERLEDAGEERPDANEPDAGDEPTDSGTAPDARTDASGPAGFDCAALDGTLVDGHCYFAIAPGTGLIWTRAKTTCETFSGSHLATLTSSTEQAAIEAAFFPSTYDYWIGLSLQGASNQVPPATCKTMPGSCPWLWVTGEKFSFSKWGRRDGTDPEPNFNGSCVRLQLTDRSWADFPCGTQLPAICEHD